ncbi:MAG: hypothetical protein KQH59_15345 [Desulfobulbaceae bacterium]|nr:hypothetical protein [Desulfobulbaceae bacterium]
MKTSELQEIIEKPITKVRRWVRDALPEDPNAQARSGYTREFTDEEGFRVFVFGYLIEQGFTTGEARKIVDAIKDWLLKRLSPIRKLPEKVADWVLYIYRNPEHGLSIDALPALEGKPTNPGSVFVTFTVRVERIYGTGPMEFFSPTLGNYTTIIPIARLAAKFRDGM